jgi:hypothetical protein
MAIVQATAYPKLYAEKRQGCKIPMETFGPHSAGTVSKNEAIAFTAADSKGSMVTNWKASEKYNVTVAAYGSQPVHAWVHTTQGADLLPHNLSVLLYLTG